MTSAGLYTPPAALVKLTQYAVQCIRRKLLPAVDDMVETETQASQLLDSEQGLLFVAISPRE